MTRNQKPNETHQGFFAFTAVFYVVALVTSNTALQFISYPSQVIGKGFYTNRLVHELVEKLLRFVSFQLLSQFQQ